MATGALLGDLHTAPSTGLEPGFYHGPPTVMCHTATCRPASLACKLAALCAGLCNMTAGHLLTHKCSARPDAVQHLYNTVARNHLMCGTQHNRLQQNLAAARCSAVQISQTRWGPEGSGSHALLPARPQRGLQQSGSRQRTAGRAGLEFCWAAHAPCVHGAGSPRAARSRGLEPRMHGSAAGSVGGVMPAAIR